MKKLLSILGSFIVVSGAAGSLVSCGSKTPSSNNDGPSAADKKKIANEVNQLLINFSIPNPTEGSNNIGELSTPFIDAFFDSAKTLKTSSGKNPSGFDGTKWTDNKDQKTLDLSKDPGSSEPYEAIGIISGWVNNYLTSVNKKIRSDFASIYTSSAFQAVKTSGIDPNEGLDATNVSVTRLGEQNFTAFSHFFNPQTFDEQDIMYVNIPLNFTVNFPNVDAGIKSKINLQFILAQNPKPFLQAITFVNEYTSYAITKFAQSASNDSTLKNIFIKDDKSDTSFNYMLNPVAVPKTIKESTSPDYTTMQTDINKALTQFELDPVNNGQNASQAFVTGLNTFIDYKVKNDPDTDIFIYKALNNVLTFDAKTDGSIFTIAPGSIPTSNVTNIGNYSNSGAGVTAQSNYVKYYQNNLTEKNGTSKGMQDFINNYYTSKDDKQNFAKDKVSSDLNNLKTQKTISSPDSKNKETKFEDTGYVGIDLNKIKLFNLNVDLPNNWATFRNAYNSNQKLTDQNAPIDFDILINDDYYSQAMANFAEYINIFYSSFTLAFSNNIATFDFNKNINLVNAMSSKFTSKITWHWARYEMALKDTGSVVSIQDFFGRLVNWNGFDFNPKIDHDTLPLIDGIDAPYFGLYADSSQDSSAWLNKGADFITADPDLNQKNSKILFRFTLGGDNFNWSPAGSQSIVAYNDYMKSTYSSSAFSYGFYYNDITFLLKDTSIK